MPGHDIRKALGPHFVDVIVKKNTEPTTRDSSEFSELIVKFRAEIVAKFSVDSFSALSQVDLDVDYSESSFDERCLMFR